LLITIYEKFFTKLGIKCDSLNQNWSTSKFYLLIHC